MSNITIIVQFDDINEMSIHLVNVRNGRYIKRYKHTLYGIDAKVAKLIDYIQYYKPKQVIFDEESVTVAFMDKLDDILEDCGITINIDSTVDYVESDENE